MLGCSHLIYNFSASWISRYFLSFPCSSYVCAFLLHSLEVAVSIEDGVNPQGTGRHQPDALEHQDSCQDTTGYILPRCNWMQILQNSFTLCRFSHDEKTFWQIAGKSSGLWFCPQILTASWLCCANGNCPHVKLVWSLIPGHKMARLLLSQIPFIAFFFSFLKTFPSVNFFSQLNVCKCQWEGIWISESQDSSISPQPYFLPCNTHLILPSCLLCFSAGMSHVC